MKRTEIDFLRAVKKVNSRYFTEVAGRKASPAGFAAKQEERKHSMKHHSETEKKNRIRKPLLAAGLAAAALLLTAGGITAAVAMRNHNLTRQNSTPDVTEQDDLFVLTDQTDQPCMRGIAKTETGIYFLSRSGGMMYYDSESGEALYLCAKPNCLHDGNEYCVATTDAYRIRSAPVYLDGYIYAAAEKRSDEGQISAVLLRYEPDGTAVKEVCGVYSGVTETENSLLQGNAELVAHRGVIWIRYSYEQFIYSEGIGAVNAVNTEQFHAWRLAAFDPGSGLVRVLQETEPTSGLYHPAGNLHGSGDYVYYSKEDSEWDDQTGKGIFRIHCDTGEIEQLLDIKGIQDFTLTPDGKTLIFWKYDSQKGYFLTFRDPETEAETVRYFKTDIWDEALGDIKHAAYWFTALFADDERIYLNVWMQTEPEPGQYAFKMRLFILDRNGNRVQITELPLDVQAQDTDMTERLRQAYTAYYGTDADGNPPDLEFLDQELTVGLDVNTFLNGAATAFDGEYFYYKCSFAEYRAALSDVLRGDGSLQKLYEHEDLLQGTK